MPQAAHKQILAPLTFVTCLWECVCWLSALLSMPDACLHEIGKIWIYDAKGLKPLGFSCSDNTATILFLMSGILATV